ncbi:MAG: hypothetical protein NZ920_02105 [Aigarchaeota archaeon]|nr:hypothetical protein [Aigarchaeota archaeon]MDW8092581.1 hypothetical protein [Nitrososphaerota archaeon]
MPEEVGEADQIRRLMQEINSVKGPLESTLMDIREVLNTLDNPLSLIGSISTKEKERTNGAPAQVTTSGATKHERPQERHAVGVNGEHQASIRHVATNNRSLRLINASTCAMLLLNLLGKTEAERLVYSMLKRSSSMSEELLAVVDHLNNLTNAMLVDLEKPNRTASSRDGYLLTSLSFLNMLQNNPEDPFISILAISTIHLLHSCRGD